MPVDSEAEAHFVCATLNSRAAADVVAAYAVSTQISTHVLEHVRVPRFDPKNELHAAIADIGRIASQTGVADEPALERLASRLWSPS